MTSRRRGHQWQPIADLPADWARWRTPELNELVAQWHRRRSALPEPGVRALLAKLVRAGKRELSTSYVHELHAELLSDQETVEAIDSLGVMREIPVLRGQWKQLPNNPGDPQSGVVRHEYCPPAQVASEMDRLLELHRAHPDVPFEIEAAWLHHRFTQIHPYQDGNGRVALSLATLVCLRAGSLPLQIDRAQKGAYVQALEAADIGDLGVLIGLFREQQQRALLQAIQLDAPPGTQPRDANEALTVRQIREKAKAAMNRNSPRRRPGQA